MPPNVGAQTPLTFQYFYDDTGQLIKVVDSTGIVIEYVYDPVGNILEIKRSTLATPNGLQLFNFTPAQGGPGTLVTIQGQGFNPTAANNIVRFGGVVAPVIAATTNTLFVTVPFGAISGPVSVTIGADTATSTTNFTLLTVPQITSINPKALVRAQTPPPVAVTGNDLSGATFSFLPAFNPAALTVTSAIVNGAGTSATLTITVGPNAAGTFVLIATKATGSSDPFPSQGNTLRILDPSQDEDRDGLSNGDEITHGTDPFNPDTDGDGFLDGAEVEAGSNPLDPNSTPLTLPGAVFTEAVAATITILNTADPSTGANPDPSVALREAAGPIVSVLNTADPSQGAAPDPKFAFNEVVGPTMSLLNIADPSQGSAPDPKIAFNEVVGPTVSLLNIGDPSQGVLPDANVFLGEAVAPTVSFLNSHGGPVVRSGLWRKRWAAALTLFNSRSILQHNSKGVMR